MAHNVAHTEAAPAMLLAAALWADVVPLISIAFLWLAHIGFDRAAGYGLKYSDAFAHTHLGHVGRSTGTTNSRE
jgi:hypothetical protein